MNASTLKKTILYSLLATSIAIGGFFGFKKLDGVRRENAVKNSSLYSYVMSKKPLNEEIYTIIETRDGISDTQIVIIDTVGARDFIFESFKNNFDYLAIFEAQRTDRGRDSLILNAVAKELDKKFVQVNSDNLDKLLYKKDTLRPVDIYGRDNACYTSSIALAGIAHALGIPSQLISIYNFDIPRHAALVLDGTCSNLVVDNSPEEYGLRGYVMPLDWFRGCWNDPPGLYQIKIEQKITTSE
ncbi:MAG: hypothetical protein ACPLYF_00010 [Fervidobacterium sp.]